MAAAESMLTRGDFIARFEAGLTSLHGLNWPEARRRYTALCRSFAPLDPPGMRITDGWVNEVAVRRFLPTAARPGRVLFLHGGGFKIGSVRSHHGVAASLAGELGREVVGVDYRLAPEADYAEMLVDCLAVAAGIDQLAVVGDSAGGRLALDLAAELSTPPVLGLIYPPVDGINAVSLGPSAPLLSRDAVLGIAEHCPGALPAGVKAGMPAERLEVLAVAQDPLTPPLEAAVTRWRQAGASVGYRCAPGMMHGALHAQARLPEMRHAWQAFCQALKGRLEGKGYR
ncbi:alpha/beta hydrolase [Halomonas alimentaria]|uniref:alpha/beta hydrolase n=1 Tax=Halomonas alimentaria TaxID=147248 RepID=UPI002493AC29|nr:alpha/beta hydrolase fold domain-containing protein [Halomonas alimentaria]